MLGFMKNAHVSGNARVYRGEITRNIISSNENISKEKTVKKIKPEEKIIPVKIINGILELEISTE